MKFGLEEHIITELNEVFEANSKVDKAIVFGSRAKGNYRPDSDIDIAIKGVDITLNDILKMQVAFEEKEINFKIDLVHYNTVKEQAVLDHIDRVGVEIFSRWQKYKLGDLVELVTKGTTPTTLGGRFVEKGVNFIKSEAINYDGRIDKSTFMFIDETTHQKLKRSQLHKDDILFSMAGVFLGKNAIVTEDLLPANTNQALAIIRLNKQKALPKYIHYYLRQENIIDLINNISGQSAQPNINFEEIKSIDIFLPPLIEQHCIAEILSGLDDKIDLLHRQNKTLEQLAEILFRQWFVEEAEESWEVGTIEDVISVKGGTTPSTSNPDFWDGEIYWTSPRDLANNASIFLFNTERKITEEGLAQIGSGLLPIGTVLLSSRAPIGYLAITQIPVAINQGYIAIICDKSISNYFMFLWCKANMETIENAGNGSVFQEISKSSFKTLEFVKPPKDKLLKFDRTVEPIFQEIMSNQIQIRTLTQLRDALLPKLMSGEIRIDLEDSRLTKPVKTKKANVGQ